MFIFCFLIYDFFLCRKSLDERAKESQVFFKSESDEESEEAEIESKSTEETVQPISDDLIDSAPMNIDVGTITIDSAPLMEDKIEDTNCLIPSDSQKETESTAKTDAPIDYNFGDAKTIEKPNEPPIPIDYDFGDAKTTKLSKLELLKERIQAHVEPNSWPSLRGSSNTIIDLNTGDVLPDQNAGRDELFERFLKHKAKPAKKQARDLRYERRFIFRILLMIFLYIL